MIYLVLSFYMLMILCNWLSQLVNFNIFSPYVNVNYLEWNINSKKSCCIRIGPHFNIKCNDITTSSGCSLPWVTEIRYLGVHITQSQLFKCSFDQFKRAFFRSLNAICSKIGRFASEEVIMQLVTQKCSPILLIVWH